MTRLNNEGRGREFIEARENMRRQGYVGDACWLHALEMTDSKGRKFSDSLNLPNGVAIPPKPMPGTRYANPSDAAADNGDADPQAKEAPDASEFANKGKAQYADAVNWVATNLHLKNVDERSAPNGIAVNLRRDCLEIPRVREIFWSNIFPKLLPSEKELSHIRKAGARNDELDDANAAYERAMQAMADDEAETTPAEPATVPTEATASRESDDRY